MLLLLLNLTLIKFHHSRLSRLKNLGLVMFVLNLIKFQIDLCHIMYLDNVMSQSAVMAVRQFRQVWVEVNVSHIYTTNRLHEAVFLIS